MMENRIIAGTGGAVRRTAILQGIALLVLLLITTWIYWPGLSGPFVLDDYENLNPLGAGAGVMDLQSMLTFVFGNHSGPSGRPVAMLSFLIDGQNWPPYVASFKYTNILIHLLCGVVLYWFCIHLFRQCSPAAKNYTWLALAVCALWLLHPLNVSTTLYVVQRMTQLMTLFALASLLCYVAGRSLMLTRPRQSLLLLGLCLIPFGLLSVLSKENGALLLLLIVIMESTFFVAAAKSRWFKTWYWLGVLLPLAIVVAYLLYKIPDASAGYDTRSFTLGERLLTQLRIVSIYISEIMLPNSVGAGLFHDDIRVSTSLFRPISTLASALFIGSLLASGLVLRRKLPVYSFGVLWFFAMQLLESTYMPLELYFEHRNYMSMIGPLIVIVWYANIYIGQIQKDVLRKLVPGVCFCLLSIMAWLSWQLSVLWGDTGDLFAHWALEKPASSRAQVHWADYLAVNGAPEAGLTRLMIAHEHYPREISLLLHTWNLSCQHDLKPPFTLKQISETEGLEHYRETIGTQLRVLLQNYLTSSCAYPATEEVVALFDRISLLSMSSTERAVYHLLFSDLYVSMRQLDPALIQLSLSFRSFPSSGLIIRQAVLVADAGNYVDGLVFLGRARAAEKDRKLFVSSNLSEIDRLERDFKRLLEAE